MKNKCDREGCDQIASKKAEICIEVFGSQFKSEVTLDICDEHEKELIQDWKTGFVGETQNDEE